MATTRNSDRYVSPGVITAAVLVVGLLTAVVLAAVTYLTALGKDPEPIIRLTLNILGAAGGLGTFVLQLVGRTTAAKTERNTGVQAGVLADHANVVAELASQVADLKTVAAPVDVAAPAGVDDDADYPETEFTEQRRVPVPAIPAYPQRRRHAQ